MKKLDELTIVLDKDRIICVYLNRHRIIGMKPWPGLKYITREVDRDNIMEALRQPPYFVEQHE
jgi:hypothetical protein